MKKDGFTLIELLAVIVILAIIALIATPIVLNIIDDTKKSSITRSAELYLNGVEQAVARYQLNGKIVTNGQYYVMNNGNLCSKILENNNCTGDEIRVSIKGVKPTQGIVTLEEGSISKDTVLILSGYNIAYNSEKNEYETIKMQTYDVILKLTNVLTKDNVVKITNLETKTLTFTPVDGYKLPNDVIVEGATKSWDKRNGNLVLSKAKSKVTITLNAVQKTLCNAVDNETTGNVPLGEFNYGDEYVCDLGTTDNSRNLTFFILEVTDNEVSLIMNKNIIDNIAWTNAETNLASKTKDWINIIDKTKITSPTKEQISNAITHANGKKWFYDNIKLGEGYWTSTYVDSSTLLWVVSSLGGFGYNEASKANSLGIRPVITISKSDLS